MKLSLSLLGRCVSPNVLYENFQLRALVQNLGFHGLNTLRNSELIMMSQLVVGYYEVNNTAV